MNAGPFALRNIGASAAADECLRGGRLGRLCLPKPIRKGPRGPLIPIIVTLRGGPWRPHIVPASAAARLD